VGLIVGKIRDNYAFRARWRDVSNPNTEDYWDDVYRREWEQGLIGTTNYNRNYGPIHDAVIELIPDGARVLDLGCGPGLLCRKIKLARPQASVTGVDFSAYTIERNRTRDANLGIAYECIDLQGHLSKLQPSFDVITICEVIEHLDEPERTVAEAVALLRDRGLLIVTCPHDSAIPDPEHVRDWGHETLFHLLAEYGETVSFRHFPPPYFDKWMMAWVTTTEKSEWPRRPDAGDAP
jgi:2-polyprenyl-3-methyl-5-hydroxy-6-metoxy-1,4-benzoquinol methylase